jgi:hypothetical protein
MNSNVTRSVEPEGHTSQTKKAESGQAAAAPGKLNNMDPGTKATASVDVCRFSFQGADFAHLVPPIRHYHPLTSNGSLLLPNSALID